MSCTTAVPTPFIDVPFRLHDAKAGRPAAPAMMTVRPCFRPYCSPACLPARRLQQGALPPLTTPLWMRCWPPPRPTCQGTAPCSPLARCRCAACGASHWTGRPRRRGLCHALLGVACNDQRGLSLCVDYVFLLVTALRPTMCLALRGRPPGRKLSSPPKLMSRRPPPSHVCGCSREDCLHAEGFGDIFR